MRSVRVDAGDRGYEVLIGTGITDRVGRLIDQMGAARVALVTQEGLPVLDGIEPVTTLLVDRGEAAKSLTTVERLVRGFAAAGLTRQDVVVALGGGTVTDLAGFAAAIWHRGTPVIHVPTTLLGQVDAAIGGKTGVNLPEGKNLVGAFWQPAGVVCDLRLLEGLPKREWSSGMGEVVKCELLGAGPIDTGDPEAMVEACVRLKAEIVGGDERESKGRRNLLNLGHTLGHALETAGGYDLRHGEAVAIGLCFAARLAADLGRTGPARPAEVAEKVGGYGLPTTMPSDADPGHLIDLMAADKKSRGDLRFVLEGPAGFETVAVDRDQVMRSLLTFQEIR